MREPSDTKILVACEFSGTVRDAFLDRGFNAISCDLLPCESTKYTDPSLHYQGDVCDILNDDWDLLIGHPPCFAGDELVLTKEGYKEIKNIVVGDEVLTHKQRYKKVTSVMQRYAPQTLTVTITGSHKIKTTNDHPFYTRHRIWKSVHAPTPTTIHIDSEPEWVCAKDLKKLDKIGMVLPPVIETNTDDETLWLMGRYVADGHLRYRNDKYEEVSFSIGKHKMEQFRSSVTRKYTEYEKRTAMCIKMYGKDFCKQFEQFGMGAINKQLPGWVLQLPKEQAKIFLDGYMSGDGCITERSIIANSISKRLMFGIAILMRRVYNRSASITFYKRNSTCIIEGRTVNQQSSWTCKCNNMKTRTISIIDGDWTWNPYRGSEITEECDVYNLSVEEDESYIVNQSIVHNCTFMTNSGVRWLYNKDKSRNEERWSNLNEAATFFLTLYNANIPHICIENPIMHGHAKQLIGIEHSQITQPYYHGHTETKATCLWLKGLPLLKETSNVKALMDTLPKNQTNKCHYMAPSKDRSKLRSITYSGIACAIADQYGKYILND